MIDFRSGNVRFVDEAPVRSYKFQSNSPLFKDDCLLQVWGNFKYPLYRYTSYDHFEKSCRTGLWSLGALFSYRDTVSFTNGQGDAAEGQRFINNINTPIPGIEIPFYFDMTAKNQHLMSCTTEMNSEFYEWPSNDCCFEISDEQFFVEIAKAANATVWDSQIASAKYCSDQQLVLSIIEASKNKENPRIWVNQHKPIDQAWQKEVRFMMEPYTTGRAYIEENPNPNGPFPRNHKGLIPNLQRAEFFSPQASRYVKLVEKR